MAKDLIITPKMNVRYAYLDKPSYTYKKDHGEYTLKVAIQDGTPEAEAFKERLEAILESGFAEATKELKPAQRAKVIRQPMHSEEENPETGDPTGFITYTFGCPAAVVSKKTGEPVALSVDMFDPAGTPLDQKTTLVRSGSVVQVGFTVYKAYCKEGTDPITNKKFHTVRLSVDLKAVQVHKLAVGTGGASANQYGFSTDGPAFEQPEEPPVPDCPFPGDEDEPPVPDGGDF